MSEKRLILAAGGTGGHLFPALALAKKMQARGWEVHLFTDKRGLDYTKKEPSLQLWLISSGGLAGLGFKKRLINIVKLLRGYFKSYKLLKCLAPQLVVGFGGYASVPPVLAAQHKGIATLIHEQNSVMGGANRLLARKADIIALGFKLQQNKKNSAFRHKTKLVGNPVREYFKTIQPYQPSIAPAPFHLLVFGGSQGAAFLSDIIPQALALLPAEYKARLRVTQQARNEALEHCSLYYKSHGIKANCAPFFDQIPALYAQAQLIICRAGASTVAEVSTANRPALFVPYPYAAGNHQHANAQSLANLGAAEILNQKSLSKHEICTKIQKYMNNPEILEGYAKQAETIGIHACAADNLVQLVESLL